MLCYTKKRAFLYNVVTALFVLIFQFIMMIFPYMESQVLKNRYEMDIHQPKRITISTRQVYSSLGKPILRQSQAPR